MRLVIQRVRQASVRVQGDLVASIDQGLLLLVGFGPADTETNAWPGIETLVRKVPQLRIFPDGDKHMNRSLLDCDGQLLLVSQFTLYADCRRGRRPSLHLACPPDKAEALFDKVCATMHALMPGKVHSGVFAADMDVSLVNWGPVTLLLDSTDI